MENVTVSSDKIHLTLQNYNPALSTHHVKMHRVQKKTAGLSQASGFPKKTFFLLLLFSYYYDLFPDVILLDDLGGGAGAVGVGGDNDVHTVHGLLALLAGKVIVSDVGNGLLAINLIHCGQVLVDNHVDV